MSPEKLAAQTHDRRGFYVRPAFLAKLHPAFGRGSGKTLLQARRIRAAQVYGPRGSFLWTGHLRRRPT